MRFLELQKRDKMYESHICKLLLIEDPIECKIAANDRDGAENLPEQGALQSTGFEYNDGHAVFIAAVNNTQ